MTKEMAAKWAPEITHWINGGNLWYFNKELNTWTKYEGDIGFNWEQPYKYVIEDEHFEARKAHALGKPIQIRAENGLWLDINPPSWMPDAKYRPKPVEVKWYEHASAENPILCWVWDENKENKVVKYIKEHKRKVFLSTSNTWWYHAIPIKPEECYQAKQEAKGKWRLPTRSELIDAFDKKVKGFNLDSGYWSSSPHADWSSSPHDSDTSEAWNVYLDNGYSYWDDKSDKKYVRCVRDTEDGLEWHEEADGFMNWDEAMKYVEEMNKKVKNQKCNKELIERGGVG